MSGTEIRVNAGVLESVVEAGGPEGTLVEVADLFYNLPARRKFLKSDAAESAQVSRTVTQLALCYPQVGFTLVNAGRKVLSCPPVASVAERLYQLYGDRPDLVELTREGGGIRVHGFVAALAEHGPTRGPQHVFVNRRIVKDKTIAHAIFDAYSVASNKERSPEVHLFLEIPPERIDVNVHPDEGGSALQGAVARPRSGAACGGRRTRQRTRPGADACGRRTSVPGGPWPRASRACSSGGVYTEQVGDWHGGSRARGFTSTEVHSTEVHSTDVHGADVRRRRMRPLIPLGQFRDTFIIAIDDEGIAIVDQHVAHERVLFERFMQRLTERPLESQGLLVPIVLELAPAEREALLSRRDALIAVRLRGRRFRRRQRSGSSPIPAVLPREECDAALAVAGQRPRGARPRPRHRRGPQAHRRAHRLPRRGQGELSAHDGEDGAHPGRAAGDGILDGVPARPARDAPDHAARSGEKLRTHLISRRSRELGDQDLHPVTSR